MTEDQDKESPREGAAERPAELRERLDDLEQSDELPGGGPGPAPRVSTNPAGEADPGGGGGGSGQLPGETSSEEKEK